MIYTDGMDSPQILIVDDDRDIVEAIEAILMMENYRTIHAFDGKEGLRAADESSPDLILLDYMLPDMNGKEVALSIKRHPDKKISSIPIIIISAAHEAQQVALEIPVNGFIEKPFDLDDLLEKVRAQLETLSN